MFAVRVCQLKEEERTCSNWKRLCCFLAVVGGGLLSGVCPERGGNAAGLTARTAGWEGMHGPSQPACDTGAWLERNAKASRDTLPSSPDKPGSTRHRDRTAVVKDALTSATQSVAVEQASKSRWDKVTEKK